MDILQIIGIGLSGAVTALVLKEYKPLFAVCIGMLTAMVFSKVFVKQPEKAAKKA